MAGDTAHHKVVIIGSGPAGLTAGIYLGRAGLQPLLFGGPEPGGQLMSTSDVGNFPGFIEDIQGPELMSRIRKQAERFGVNIREAIIDKVDFTKRPFTLFYGDASVTADCVIVATGASARWLGLESEQRLRGKGVSACATCDGFFFKGKDVVVVGGGDTAMEDATFLTKFATHVTIVHRKNELSASKIMQARAKNNPKISFELESTVAEVTGQQSVDGIIVENLATHEKKIIKAQGLFVAIGHSPNTAFLGGQLSLTKGYIQVTDNTKTSVEGVFAGGDVQDWRYRQAVSAAGLGCMAALDAEKFLSHKTE